MNSKTTVMTVSSELNIHITEKIQYHQRLLQENLDVEEYLQCAYHRDEIKRLASMLETVEVETLDFTS